MKQLIADVDTKFADVAKNNPGFKDKKAVLLAGSFTGGTVTATLTGWRTDFLTAMGSRSPTASPRMPSTTTGPRSPATSSPTPRLRRRADLVHPRATPTKRRCPPIRGRQAGHSERLHGLDLAGRFAFASPLSYPVVADQLPLLLSRALA